MNSTKGVRGLAYVCPETSPEIGRGHVVAGRLFIESQQAAGVRRTAGRTP